MTMKPHLSNVFGLRRTFCVAAMLCLLLSGCGRKPAESGIAFLGQGNGHWQVWWMPAPEAPPQQISRFDQDVARLSWFPDGREVLANLQDGSLVRLDIRGKNSQPVKFPFAGVLDAVVGPDGRQVAFSMTLGESVDQNDIWTYDLVSAERRKLAALPGLQHEPVWSPDGKTIYFLSGKGQQTHDIWRVDVATGSTEQLTVNALYHFDIAARDDGALVYSGNQEGHYDLWLRPAEGEAERLTEDAALDARPAWSADGRSLVFESTRGGTAPDLWTLDIRSKQTRRLTSMTGGARMPLWAPAGDAR